jgi:flagella synthesis protein FlgN
MRFDTAALCRILQREKEALTAFTQMLRDEQSTLVGGELERLAAHTESKSACLLELTRISEQRLQWLRERGLAADNAGMERLLREHADNSPQARTEWQQIREAAIAAKQLNQINGTLIGTRLNGAQRALSVLFSAAKIPGAYTADGSTVCYRTAHELAVA